jgi:hypothetical protein
VKIKMSEFGTAVHSYPNTTEYGYLKLEEIASLLKAAMATRTRTALLRGAPAETRWFAEFLSPMHLLEE